MSATLFEPLWMAGWLEQSLATLDWAVAQVPAGWTHSAPWPGPADPPPWSVAQNLAHMAIYEESVAAPVLEELLAGGDGSIAVPSLSDPRMSEEVLGFGDLSQAPLEAIMARLRAARRRQIDAVRTFTPHAFNVPVTSRWSRRGEPLPAGWVAAKTAQHTWEHGNVVLQTALFARR